MSKLNPDAMEWHQQDTSESDNQNQQQSQSIKQQQVSNSQLSQQSTPIKTFNSSSSLQVSPQPASSSTKSSPSKHQSTTVSPNKPVDPNDIKSLTAGLDLLELDDDERAELEAAAKEEAEAKAKADQQSSNQQNQSSTQQPTATITTSSSKADIAAINQEKAVSAAKPHDPREHINIVFIGHVDAGKSTISGMILLSTGQVDERTMQKYEKEAKEKNRESWYLAYILDTNEEERAKGKTVEVGRAKFTTETKRYTLLDAPGHKNYVPNMIGGASQADVGVLVISARKGEFEAGFDRGGQTREHAMLAKTLGLQKLVVLVNKMDDSPVNGVWDQKRYDEIVGALSPFLKKCGFNLKTDVVFIPASGFTGLNIHKNAPQEICPWYTAGKSLFQVLDALPPIERDPKGPLRLPVIARYKDMGALYCIGKLESGTLLPNTKLMMMPNKIEVSCTGIYVEEDEVDCAKPGENVIVRIKGIEEEDVQDGFVLSYTNSVCRRARKFDAQIHITELLEHKPLMTQGYECVLHIHTLTIECQLINIIHLIDKKTGEKTKRKFLKQGDAAAVRFECQESIAIERFGDFPALGRFTLRDEGKTIAIGKVLGMASE